MDWTRLSSYEPAFEWFNLVQYKTEMHALVKVVAHPKLESSLQKVQFMTDALTIYFILAVYMSVRKVQRQVAAMIGKSSLISSI